MGWKSVMRSVAAAHRRAERESLRQQREYERQRKQYEKMQELQQAAYDVQVYENYVEVLCSVHKDCGESWNWKKIKNSSPPVEPVRNDYYENNAKVELDSFKPSFLDKLLRRVEKKRIKLSRAVEEGKRRDDLGYHMALEEYKKQHSEWQEMQELADLILDGDAKAYMEAIKQVDPFSEIKEIGSAIDFRVQGNELIEVDLHVNSDEIIPKEERTLLKSGKLSTKKMSKSKFYEFYQDYICGCVLRVARELFALLPIEMTLITAIGEQLNTKTGYIEEQPILSVAIPKKTISKMNIEFIDPSDSMDNFLHNMRFSKTKGFSAVKRIKATDLE